MHLCVPRTPQILHVASKSKRRGINISCALNAVLSDINSKRKKDCQCKWIIYLCD